MERSTIATPTEACKTDEYAQSRCPATVVPERLLLLILFASIMVSTLAPFEVSGSGTEWANRFREVIDVASQGSVLNAVGHVAVFCFLGLLLAWVYDLAPVRLGAVSVAAAMVFCVGLESAQLFMEGRHARISDVWANFAGLLLGIRLAAWTPSIRGRQALRQLGARYPAGLYAGILLSATFIWWSAGAWGLFDGLKMDWDPEFHLLIGSETDGSRPWLGEVRYVGIYGQALSPAQVAWIHARRDARRDVERMEELELLAGYDFVEAEGRTVVPRGSVGSTNLLLEMPEGGPVIEPGYGVLLTEDTLLASRGPASALTEAIVSAGAFSIEAWVHPLNLAQHGPARIVSLSKGIWRRNFTFGPDGAEAVFRVANRVNGPNGSQYELRVRQAVQETLQHWMAVYDHGASALYVDGQRLEPVMDLRQPTIRPGFGHRPASHIAMGILLALTMAIPLQVLLSSCMQVGRRQHLTVLVIAFALGCLPYSFAGVFVSGPWRVHPIIWFGGSLFVAYPLCLTYVRRPGSCSRVMNVKRGER